MRAVLLRPSSWNFLMWLPPEDGCGACELSVMQRVYLEIHPSSREAREPCRKNQKAVLARGEPDDPALGDHRLTFAYPPARSRGSPWWIAEIGAGARCPGRNDSRRACSKHPGRPLRASFSRKTAA